MARTSASKSTSAAIIRGSGNVFADLGMPDAEERQTRLRLAYALNAVIDRGRLSQAAAAARLGLNRPKVSALRNYKLDGFSVERLMTLLTTLDQDVEIVIQKAALARGGAGQRGGGVRRWPQRVGRNSGAYCAAQISRRMADDASLIRHTDS